MSFLARHRIPLQVSHLAQARHQLHSSAVILARARTVKKQESYFDYFNDDEVMDAPMEPNDTTAPGHFQLMQERQMLYYLRLIDHELPKLVDFRKPFVPPSSSQPLSIRSVSYAEEDHPLARKRVVVVPVAWLPLKDKKAIHNIKVIAGVRWQKDPPAGSGFSESEGAGEHGYIKIACEDFPEPAMNLKWASDALDRLLDAANNGKDFSDIPVDTRHIQAKEKKAAKGAHAKGRGNKIPSLKDFPKEWLPKSPVSQPEEGARTSQ